MGELKREDWHKLTENHRWALKILDKAGGAHVQPEAPRAMRFAFHDLWRFKFATRHFGVDGLSYQITFLGRRAAASVEDET